MVFNEKDIHDLLFDAPRKVGSVNVRSLVKDLIEKLGNFLRMWNPWCLLHLFSISESFASFRCICPNICLHEGTSWKRLSLPALQILKVWFFAASFQIFKLIQNCGETNISQSSSKKNQSSHALLCLTRCRYWWALKYSEVVFQQKKQSSLSTWNPFCFGGIKRWCNNLSHFGSVFPENDLSVARLRRDFKKIPWGVYPKDPCLVDHPILVSDS